MRAFLTVFVILQTFLGVTASPAPVDCGALLVKQFPHKIGPQLAIMNALTDKYIEKIGSELGPVSRWAYYRQVNRMKASEDISGFGVAKPLWHQLKLNPLIIDHPIIRMVIVHEAQHMADQWPAIPSAANAVLTPLDPNHVKKMESAAFGREYDYLKELLNTPGFDAEAALAEFERKAIPDKEMRQDYYPKYKLDDPVFDEYDGISRQFQANPAKFYRDEGARAALHNYMLRQAEWEFRGRIGAAEKKSREQYISDRLFMYDEKIAQGKFQTKLTAGFAGFMVSSCSLLYYVVTHATIVPGP